MGKMDKTMQAMKKIEALLSELPSRDAALTVAFFADKFVSTRAARACYEDVPDRPAKERAADLRKSAAALCSQADALEAEEELDEARTG